MELKPYQQKVIGDLASYLHLLREDQRIDTAFNRYWTDKIGPYDPIRRKGMKPYQNSVPGAVHLCLKVPTAGGKTFIACNALRTIFDAYNDTQIKTVVWLVPWSNLLSQTVNNLSNPDHPYRQKLNALFNGRVGVYEKKDLLYGTGFNPTVVREQLSIFVLSFASIRAKRKEDRKIFEDNGYLAQFAKLQGNDGHVLPDTEETALINVIRSFKPVVVVDESHNAESELSTEMLQNLNPGFVLDLTATPKEKSNIISFVNALELKRENMVKLPVVVYNHHDKTEVINSALHLQRQLELLAQAEERQGGKYIRPMVLFQAQPRTRDENIDFRKLKAKLLQLGIPEAEIKIKTADIDELKGQDLMSRECKVKYIITVNALKEGWDCPFAYILASLADRSSAVDVEQILGRVLRQPYVVKHSNYQLNLSYVLTASARFHDTLQNIVKGLQLAGFSSNDYRSAEAPLPTGTVAPTPQPPFPNPQPLVQDTPAEQPEDDIDVARIQFHPQATPEAALQPATIEQIAALAKATNDSFEQKVAALDTTLNDGPLFNPDIQDKVVQYPMRAAVADVAKALQLPRFYVQGPVTMFTETDWLPLHQERLLAGFRLSRKDTELDIESIRAELYKVDLEEIRQDEYSPKFFQVAVQDPLIEYILAKPRAEQVKDITNRLVKEIGNMYPILEQEIKKFVGRVVEDMSAESLHDLLTRPESYARLLRKKIKAHADVHAEEQFSQMENAKELKLVPDFSFQPAIVPGRIAGDIANSLYEKEGVMNGFETAVILEIATLDNILFWHRNLGPGKGFAINGFKNNHYPDFIIVTKKGNVILLETKGDDRDNSDSAAKNRLGRKWAAMAGYNYSYFMVFESKKLEDTLTVEQAKNAIRKL